MRTRLILIISTTLTIFSCDKETEKIDQCGCDGTKTETVSNIFGLVIQTDEGFEILTDEKGILKSCVELNPEFKKDFQPVTVSGQLRLPCKKIFGEFKITPIELTEITIRPTNYDKTDITLTVIKSEDYGFESGFGYCIKDTRTPFGGTLCAPTRPAVGGLIPFDTEDKAIKTGLLSVYIARGGVAFITPDILQYINVVE